MKQTKIIMGMPVSVEIDESSNDKSTKSNAKKVFDYFREVDRKYSPFKNNSEVGKYNRGEKVGREFKQILKLARSTQDETGGYFDVTKSDGSIDPSGIVKGWAIKNAAGILRKGKYKRFYVDAGGDVELVGGWKWGIRNPFNVGEIVKVLNLSNCGVATSGTYERGKHIWDPKTKEAVNTDIVSITVIGPNVYEADRFATAAFAMGRIGISFIESKKGLEGYMINNEGVATYTSGFEKYVQRTG